MLIACCPVALQGARTERAGTFCSAKSQTENQIHPIPTVYYKVATESCKARMKAVMQKHGWKASCWRDRWMFRAETSSYWQDAALECGLSANRQIYVRKSLAELIPLLEAYKKKSRPYRSEMWTYGNALKEDEIFSYILGDVSVKVFSLAASLNLELLNLRTTGWGLRHPMDLLEWVILWWISSPSPTWGLCSSRAADSCARSTETYIFAYVCIYARAYKKSNKALQMYSEEITICLLWLNSLIYWAKQ